MLFHFGNRAIGKTKVDSFYVTVTIVEESFTSESVHAPAESISATFSRPDQLEALAATFQELAAQLRDEYEKKEEAK